MNVWDRRTDYAWVNSKLPAMLTIAFLLVMTLIGFSVLYFLNIDASNSIDYRIAQAILETRNEHLIVPFIRVSALGQAYLVVPFIVLCALILWLLNRRGFVLPLILSSACAATMSTLGKLAFERPRPLDAVLLEHSYSFPSGHATISVAFYGFVAYLLIRSTQHKLQRVLWFILGIGVIALIGFSRIYLGVHYLSDVWTGYLIGTLWLITGISRCEWLIARNGIDAQASFDVRRRNGAWLLLAFGLATYLVFVSYWQP
jgi:membrane-associated phospholipid phosphatase